MIALQLIPADLVVHDRHAEGVPGKLLNGHPDHPAPAGDGTDRRRQAARQRDFIVFRYRRVSPMFRMVRPDLSSRKRRNSGRLPPARAAFFMARAWSFPNTSTR